MLRQLIVAGAVTLATTAVHSIAMAGVMRVVRRREAARGSFRFEVHLILLMIGVVVVLNAAHLIEVAIWAVVYDALGVVPDNVSSFYFALVNFTTLGYGDVVPAARWQLLGPLTTINGVLLLGWSTAVIFAVLSSQGNMPGAER
jgi:hypothetical protein